MATYEEEYRRFQPVIRRLIFISLLGKKVEVRRAENFVREGPNIIVGNHCGAFKDVAVLLRVVPRPIFFTANKMIFSKKDFDFLIRKHLRRHMKDFGLVVNAALNPLKYLFSRYVSTHIAKVGTIPVDIYSGKREAMKICQEYLQKGRAIIALQGRGRVHPQAAHPYIAPFKRGASILAYNLFYDNGIAVPVTPLALFGTHKPLGVPAKVGVNVGEPMYITGHLGNGLAETVENFRTAVEARVKALFMELISA